MSFDNEEADETLLARQVIAAKKAAGKRTPTEAQLVGMMEEIHLDDLMSGSGTLTITLSDEAWELADDGFFDPDKDGRLDIVDLNYGGHDRWWRLSQVTMSGGTSSNIGMVFMERPPVLLDSITGPFTTNRAKHTRAEFLKVLTDKVTAFGGLDFESKELHAQQRIAGKFGHGFQPRTGGTLLIGDSLSLAPHITPVHANVHGLRVHAAGGETLHNYGLPYLQGLPDNQIPGTVIMAMGTNDNKSLESMFEADVREVLRIVGPDRHLIWPNIAINLSGGEYDETGFNRILSRIASRHENMTIVPWKQIVAKDPSMLTDGIHPNSTGDLLRAHAIRDAITTGAVKAPRKDRKQKGLSRDALGTWADKYTDRQIKNMEILLTACEEQNAPAKAHREILMSGFGESSMTNVVNSIGFGGVLQGQVARPAGNPNWFAGMDEDTRTAEEAKSWLLGGRGYQGGGGIHLAKTQPHAQDGLISTTVEGSGEPASYYGAFAADADHVIEAWGGADAGPIGTSYTKAYHFTVGRNETYWDAMLRLADEVNWALFVDGDTVFYDSEMVLVKQKPAAVIHRDDPAVLDFDMTWDRRHIATDLTLTLICDMFAFRAGEVLLMKGFGPGSTGSSAKPKLPGRWLIAEVDRDRSSLSSKLTLKQPERPKAEPAPERGSRDVTPSLHQNIGAIQTGAETNGEVGTGRAVDTHGYHATKAVTSRLWHWTNGGSDVWICLWMVPQLVWAMRQGWDGKISEGWRSITTQNLYANDGHHTIGVNVAKPGTSNHGLTIYSGGAIDTPSYATLARVLRGWKPSKANVANCGPLDPSVFEYGKREAMIGAGAVLPKDPVHFSAKGN